MKNIEERPRFHKDLQIEVHKAKSTIANLWQNTVNTRKQAFLNHYHTKKLGEIDENLLACNPPKMPRESLPRTIDNEPESKTEIRKQLSIEKLRVKLLCYTRDRKDTSNDSKDSEMVAHISQKFNEEVAQRLIKK